MVYKRMVEIGRVVFVAKGDDDGKLAAIVDVVDGNRALVDGPSTGVKRSVRNFKDLHLTKFRIPLRHGMRTKNVKKAFDEAKISEKWAETLWAQKLAKKEIKAKMTDFDRFKLMRAKQLRNRLVRLQLAKLRKTRKTGKPTKEK
ncbi:60S ribosomal protein L14, putative [Brugia malayi]|uniref:Large ribosomal subunit protein eL14 n=1 Tax=Brugia malayi TaxID=6279 RepID=A0A4E9FHH3_BRUMA|nr:60S ribosomal protein L14, putative [Brugia malayi]VIO95814.1 60S ribosomal protein L14, putative [Brugia malayi]